MPRPVVRDLTMPKYLRMAMVAPSGFGKTVFCGTADRALFLTTDPEGTASAAAWGSDAKEIEVTNQEQMNDAYVFLEQGGISELDVDTVIVDNLTEVQKQFMDAAMSNAVTKEPDRSLFVPAQREYLIEQNAVIDFVRKMCTLPVNLIFTIHRKGMEDGEGEPFYSAAVRGKQGEIAQSVLGYMNVVGMGEVLTIKEKEVRRIYFDHVRQFRGKDRFQVLGKFRDELTVPDMMTLLFPEGQNHDTPPVAKATRPRPKPRATAAK